MRVYQRDSDGFYMGEVTARHDPMVPGAFLIPAGCVLEAPPAPGGQQAARHINGVWRVVPDMEGVEFWDANGQPGKIERRGEGLPQGASLIEPEAVKAARLTAEENAAALAELAALDMASIRAMREYIAAQADAPQILKDREAAAVAARGRLK